MWPGPYGEWGSRKYLLASLDQSLARMGLDYVDIFYSHRLDPEHAARGDDGRARHGRAPGQGALRGHLLLLARAHRRRRSRSSRALGTPLLIHQPSYSLLNRWIEQGCWTCSSARRGRIVFSPLAQGLLTDRYLDGIPEDSRVRRGEALQRGLADRGERWRASARWTRSPARRGQTLAQMALAWVLRDPRVTSTLVGRQPRRAAGAERGRARATSSFSAEELAEIDRYARRGGINIWAPSSDA